MMDTLKIKQGLSAGFTLLEVLIGMVIFAVGMMALMQMQGNLSKSSADANARSVAVNVAEETIESARSFVQVTGDEDLQAFNNIVTGSRTETRGGIAYTVARTVTDYYYTASGTVNATGSFSTTKPSGVVNPDMKMLQVAVTWGAGQSFQIDQGQASTTLSPGSITLTDMISSITSPSGGKVLLNSSRDSLYGPPVDYSPGQNPDIVSIQLGDNRFKESTKPLPRVFNANERVETSFDVVTYSQDNEGATFLRREEFLAVACECTLRVPAGETEGGLRPTLWNGNNYTEGEFVSKPYGESNRDNAVNFQSEFCGVCCRDHHDGGTGENDDVDDSGRALYSPFKAESEYMTAGDGNSDLVGNHKHYDIGGLDLAVSDGDVYFEACRLIRKDGFFRVAQDLRQESLNSFPQSYLDEDTEVDVYSKYVTDAVSEFTAAADVDYHLALTPHIMDAPLAMAPEVLFPGAKTTNRTNMSSTLPTQQLRARGIYVDYITNELRTIIDCLAVDGATGQSCGVGASNSALEIIPFYDVQLTWLGRWAETPVNLPIGVTNDAAIATGNTHDRGRASLTTGSGSSNIDFKVNRGNLGLTGSDPIDPTYTAALRDYRLHALAVVAAAPPPGAGFLVKGSITSEVPGVKASDVEIAASNGAQCNRTLTGFECVVSTTATNPRIKVSNYFKRTRDLVGCSSVLDLQGTEHSGTELAQNWTSFDLPKANVSNANVVIMSGTACP